VNSRPQPLLPTLLEDRPAQPSEAS
jgi:hypothetical protein